MFLNQNYPYSFIFLLSLYCLGEEVRALGVLLFIIVLSIFFADGIPRSRL